MTVIRLIKTVVLRVLFLRKRLLEIYLVQKAQKRHEAHLKDWEKSGIIDIIYFFILWENALIVEIKASLSSDAVLPMNRKLKGNKIKS